MPYKNSRVDRPLTNLSIKYVPEGYICNQALTPLPVPRWTGILAGYGTAHLQLNSTRVFDRGEYRTVQTVDRNLTTTYRVDNHGLKDIVSERDREEAESPFMARNDVTMGLRTLLMTEKEHTLSTLLTTAANYNSANTTTLSGNAQWSDYTNSDPLANIKDAKIAVFNGIKMPVNAAIIPYNVMQTLRFHPKLTGIYGQTGKFAPLSDEQIGTALGIPLILVPMAGYDNAGTETLFWDKDVVLYHRAPRAMRMQRTFGYGLSKRGHESRVFIKNPEAMVNSELILSDMAYSFRIQHNQGGYLFKAAIA